MQYHVMSIISLFQTLLSVLMKIMAAVTTTVPTPLEVSHAAVGKVSPCQQTNGPVMV